MHGNLHDPLKQTHRNRCPIAILLSVQNDHVIPSYWTIALGRLRRRVLLGFGIGFG
jgi:hypothetical protein